MTTENPTSTSENTKDAKSSLIPLDSVLDSLESFQFSSSSDDEDVYGRYAFKQKCHSFDHYRFPTQPVLSKLNLTEVNLNHTGLGDKGVEALSEALKVNSTITALYLRDNWITPTGLEALVNAMAKNRTILLLDLSDNQLGMKRLNQRCGDLFVRLLERNNYLEHLVLKGNSIADKDVVTLCDFLCDDNHLRTLDLSYNSIGSVSGEAIKTLLSTNGYLKNLNLEWNSLGDEGSLSVLEGLKNNNVLESINLAWCGVSSKGALDIVTVIQENTSLVEINLEHNNLEYEAVQFIAAIFKENSSIRRFFLSHNRIGKLGVMAMIEGVQDNASLELTLDNAGVDWRQELILKEMTQRAEQHRQKRTGEHLDVYQLEQDVLLDLAQQQDWKVIKVTKPQAQEPSESESEKEKSKGKKKTAAAPGDKKKAKKVKAPPKVEITLPEERYVLV